MQWSAYERSPNDLTPFSLSADSPLKLLFPYNHYISGTVLYHYGSGRRYCLFEKQNSKTEQTKISPYARVLFNMYLWDAKQETLPSTLRTSHINADYLDDRIANYEALTQSEINRKHKKEYDRWAVLICPVCGTHFRRIPSTCQLHADHLRTVLCCSLKCDYDFATLTHPSDTYAGVVKSISECQVFKIIRVWKKDGHVEDEQMINDTMLDFNLEKVLGKPTTIRPSINVIANAVQLAIHADRRY